MQKDKNIIRTHLFKFGGDSGCRDNSRLEIYTEFDQNKYGLNIEQELKIYPYLDSCSSTIINLGMNFITPQQLRALADRLENEIQKAKEQIIKEL